MAASPKLPSPPADLLKSEDAFKKVTDFIEKLSAMILPSSLGKSLIRHFLSGRPFARQIDRVEIKDSPVHGKGVFAKEDIKKGELITFYPADAWINNGMINTYTMTAEKAQDLSLYAYRFTSGDLDIFGDPAKIDDPAYLGHMINDAVEYRPRKSSEREYAASSLKKSNIIFHVIAKEWHVAIVAIRPIKAGEELFVCYGPQYWEAQTIRSKKKK